AEMPAVGAADGDDAIVAGLQLAARGLLVPFRELAAEDGTAILRSSDGGCCLVADATVGICILIVVLAQDGGRALPAGFEAFGGHRIYARERDVSQRSFSRG